MKLGDLSTPALVVDGPTLDANLTTMAAARPGTRCRPHVKAHKTTALAHRQAAVGHPGFTAATPREVLGLAAAGLGTDLLLANETVDAHRLRAMADCDARVTVAVDSDATVDAAAAGGIREVLVDVNVGLPRCGCDPADAARPAARARAAGMEVRGVMGYEGHVTLHTDRAARAEATERAMALLQLADDAVGGDVISAGSTVNYDLNTLATEIQAGSYALMDCAFAPMVPEFRPAVWVEATVISVSPQWAVADCGLKSLAMDHGAPTVDAAGVLVVSDEHLTFRPEAPVRVGDRIRVWPAHVDPTVAYHERMQLIDGEDVVESWPVDLRGW